MLFRAAWTIRIYVAAKRTAIRKWGWRRGLASRVSIKWKGRS